MFIPNIKQFLPKKEHMTSNFEYYIYVQFLICFCVFISSFLCSLCSFLLLSLPCYSSFYPTPLLSYPTYISFFLPLPLSSSLFHSLMFCLALANFPLAAPALSYCFAFSLGSHELMNDSSASKAAAKESSSSPASTPKLLSKKKMKS